MPAASGLRLDGREDGAQLAECRPRMLHHVAPGVAAELVATGICLPLPVAVLFPGVSASVIAVAVQLDRELLLRPAAVDKAAAGRAIGFGKRQVALAQEPDEARS